MQKYGIIIAMKTHNTHTGFTLLEVMITIVVMTLGILALYTMQVGSVRANATANTIGTATNLLSDQIERIMSLTFRNDPANDPAILVDNNILDANNNDISGVNGLDETTAATADFVQNFTITGTTYTLYTNVALDFPVQDAATIRTIIQWRDGFADRELSYDYIKMRN